MGLKSLNLGELAASPADLALKAPLAAPVFTGISDFSAGGAYFGTAAAANLLDDYEEGDWTPTLSGSTGSVGITYSTATGKYTKIGNAVTVIFRIILSAKTSISGSVIVGGLPFASGAIGATSGCSIGYYSGLAVTKIVLTGSTTPSSSAIDIFGNATASASPTSLLDADIGATTRLEGTLTYSVG